MIKAIFFDIDGTLISFRTHRMPESTKRVLSQLRQQGVLLFIATGRSATQVDFMEEYFHFDGYITMNGQYCRKDAEVIFEQAIPVSSLKMLLPYLESHPELGCGFVELNYAYFNRLTPQINAMWAKLGSTAPAKEVDDPTRIYTHKTYQLSAYITPGQEPEFLRQLPGCRAVRWHPEFADMIPSEGGKALGIRKMLEYHGLTLSESMAFGDGGNDIDMLETAGLGVAMGNAGEEVKRCADYVTADVDEDGIRNALLQLGVLER